MNRNPRATTGDVRPESLAHLECRSTPYGSHAHLYDPISRRTYCGMHEEDLDFTVRGRVEPGPKWVDIRVVAASARCGRCHRALLADTPVRRPFA